MIQDARIQKPEMAWNPRTRLFIDYYVTIIQDWLFINPEMAIYSYD